MKKILAFSVSVGINLIYLILIGFMFSELPENAISIIMIISLILTVILMIIGLIVLRYTKKVYSKENFKQIVEKMKEEHEQSENNFTKIKKQVNKTNNLALLFYFSFLISLIILTSSLIALSIKGSNLIPAILITFYMLSGLIASYFNVEDRPRFGYYLNKEDYPIINNMIADVQNDLNVKKPINLFSSTNHNTISVNYYKGQYNIVMGVYHLLFLNFKELKAIMYHEVAHILNKDIYHSRKQYGAYRLYQRSIEGDYNVFSFGSFFLLGFNNLIEATTTKYDIFVSRQIEEKTDEFVKNRNLNEAFINAVTKSLYFGLFIGDYGIKSFIPIAEEPSKTYYQDVILEFIEVVEKRRKIYDYIALNEYQAKMESHPTVSTRMKNFGVTKVNIDLNSRLYNKEEITKLLDIFEEVSEEDIENYKGYRENNYLAAVKIIEKYETNPNDDVKDMLDYGYALMGIIEVEKAVKVFETLLEVDDNIAQAHGALGYIYLNYYYDEKGVEHIKKAAELNRNYVEDLEHIGNYYKKMGKEESLKTFREEFLDEMQKHFNEYEGISDITIKTKLEKPTLDETKLNSIYEYIKSLEFVKEYFVVRKDINENFYTHIVCVVKNEKATDEETNEGMNNIFKFLDLKDEQYALVLVNSNMLYNKLKKTVEPTKIA